MGTTIAHTRCFLSYCFPCWLVRVAQADAPSWPDEKVLRSMHVSPNTLGGGGTLTAGSLKGLGLMERLMDRPSMSQGARGAAMAATCLSPPLRLKCELVTLV
eukprot:scaffold159177_cov14-Tisochrysis_lutea.AAC.1